MNIKNNEINNKIINMNELLNQFTIYIPDMQRDYCWGLNKKDDKTLFHEFLDTLYNLYKNKDDFTMGLFYGYLENDRLYLCDGQQRITSLYLILLYAYKLGKVDESLLIHSNMPSLQYAVRDSSLFFLNDLINNKIDIDNIENIINSDWYFDEYNNDDTIKNMLASIKTIMGKKDIINDEFISYILNKINFIFIDMKTRENGEETYVLLNTTGESLSEMENLKPYLVFDDNAKNMQNYSDKWEEIEKFFWVKNNKDYKKAEAGFNEFIRWIVKITCYENNTAILKEKNKLYSFFANEEKQAIEVIQEYFNIIYNKEIEPLLDEMEIKLQFNGEYLEDKKIYSLFAAIYGLINEIPKESYYYKIFRNIIKRDNNGGIEKIKINEVIEFFKNINNEDNILYLLADNDSFLKNDIEEYLKLTLYNMLNNNKLINLFAEAYEFSILKNRILLLIEATVYEIKPYENIIKNNQIFVKIEEDKKLYDKFEFLKNTIINNNDCFITKFEKNINAFKSKIVEKIANNELIINMLTYDAPEYPVTNKIKDIANRLRDSPNICIFDEENISKWFYNKNINYQYQILFLYRLFNNSNLETHHNEKWSDIIKFPKILEYTQEKRFGFNQIFYARKKTNSDNEIKAYTIYLFHEFLKNIEIDNYEKHFDYHNNMKIFIWDLNIKDKGEYNRYGGIICIEKKLHDKIFVIDIYAENKNKFILQIFFRDDNITQNDINNVQNIEFKQINDIYDKVRYQAVIENSSYEDIVKKCDSILEKFN